MKKFFTPAFVAIVAMVATAFTSCGSDDTSDTQTPTSQKTSTEVKFVVCTTPEQTNYFDMTFVLNKNGKDTTVSVSQMTHETVKENYESLQLYKTALLEYQANATTYGRTDVSVNVYTCSLGSFTSGSFSVKKMTYSVKENHPTAASVDILYSYGFYAKGYEYNNKYDAVVVPGVGTDAASLKGVAAETVTVQDVAFSLTNQ